MLTNRFSGLEADQKVIAAHGCYAMTATAALTAQNTTGVFGIQVTPADFVRTQIDACLDDIPVDVVKIGNLPGKYPVPSQLSDTAVSMAIVNNQQGCWLLPRRFWS